MKMIPLPNSYTEFHKWQMTCEIVRFHLQLLHTPRSKLLILGKLRPPSPSQPLLFEMVSVWVESVAAINKG